MGIKRIYKYKLEMTDVQEVQLPTGYQILTVQNQSDTPCLWALVDPDELNTESVTIEMYGTGSTISYDMGITREYIATFQIYDGAYVFHVFKYTGI